MQITLQFTPAAPPANKTFGVLLVRLTDAGGTVRERRFTAEEIAADAVAQPDGTFLLPVNMDAAVGP